MNLSVRAVWQTTMSLLLVAVIALLSGCGDSRTVAVKPAAAAVSGAAEQETPAEPAAADTVPPTLNTQLSTQPSDSFPDPAPPKVNRLQPAQPPAPVDYERVTFHAKPKPLPKGAVTHDWPSFLGPTHDARSTETKLLKEWPAEGPSVVWELATGNGYASPAIQGEFLVYPHRVGDEVLIECLHPETGQSYWQYKFPTEYQDRYGYSNGPRASPVIDGDRVYIFGAEGNLLCMQLQSGEVIWQREVNREFNVQQDFFGTVMTPLVEGDLLVINVGAPGGPCVVAFDKLTGRAVWGAGDKWGPSYSSPVAATIHGQRRLFVFAGGDSDPPAGGLMCLDPANGRVDFEFPWRSRDYESVNASCPVVIGDRVFISASYKTGSALLRVKEDFNYETVWTAGEVGTHWNTAVHHEGYLYCFDGRNEPDASLVCVDMKTGKVVWREILEWDETIEANGEPQKITASPLRGSLLHVDGRFLCLGELGHLLWLDLSPKRCTEVARSRLFLAQQSWALPVLSRGLVYISQNNRDFISKKGPRLLCYDLRGTE